MSNESNSNDIQPPRIVTSHTATPAADPPPNPDVALQILEPFRDSTGPHVFSSDKPSSAPPSPTMFPLTQEIFGTEPRPRRNDPICIEVDCPTPPPNIVGDSKFAEESTSVPTPLPMSPKNPEGAILSEADADCVDIWFFRNRLNPDLLDRAESMGPLYQWKIVRQDN